jgi:hypothetical protein
LVPPLAVAELVGLQHHRPELKVDKHIGLKKEKKERKEERKSNLLENK